jgi:enediyne polyketide synthase
VAAGTSRSHSGALTLTVTAATGQVAGDWQYVAGSDALSVFEAIGPGWNGLREQIGRAAAEPDHAVAARLWTASECLGKSGRAPGTPLTLAGIYDDGWVLLRAGRELIATVAVPEALAPSGAISDQRSDAGAGTGTVCVALLAKEDDAAA